MMPLLTIMIPTTPDRQNLFDELMKELHRQKASLPEPSEVQILWAIDNKEISVGAKRQWLLENAKGEFVVGIDSDDWVDECYMMQILNAIKRYPKIDHVGFLEHCTIDGKESLSIFSSSHLKWEENAHGYDHVRCANPKSVIRRSVALQVGFKDVRYGEDRIFSESVTPLVKSEVFIDKILYYYRHESTPHHERFGITE